MEKDWVLYFKEKIEESIFNKKEEDYWKYQLSKELAHQKNITESSQYIQ